MLCSVDYSAAVQGILAQPRGSTPAPAGQPAPSNLPELDHQKSDAIILLSRLRTRRAEVEQARGDIDEWERRVGFQKSNGTRAVQDKLGELTAELEARVRAVMDHLDSEELRLLQPLQASRAVLDGHIMETERAIGMLERATEPVGMYTAGWNPVVHEQSAVQLGAALKEVERVLQLEGPAQVVNWPTNGGMSGPDEAAMVGIALNDRERAAAMLAERAEAAETIKRLHDSIDELRAVSEACTRALQEQVDNLQQENMQAGRRATELQCQVEQAKERQEQTASEHATEIEELHEQSRLAEARWQRMLEQQEGLATQERLRTERFEGRCKELEVQLEHDRKHMKETAAHERVCNTVQKTSFERAIEQQSAQMEDLKESEAAMKQQWEASTEYSQLLEKGLQSMMGDWYGNNNSMPSMPQSSIPQTVRTAHKEYLYSIGGDGEHEVITRHKKLENEGKTLKNPIGNTREAQRKKKAERRKKQETAAAAQVVMPQVALVAENERLRRMMGAGLGSRYSEPPRLDIPRRVSETSERRAPSTTAGRSERSISPRSDSGSSPPVWQDAVSHEYDRLMKEYLESDATPEALKSVLMHQSEQLRQRAGSSV